MTGPAWSLPAICSRVLKAWIVSGKFTGTTSDYYSPIRQQPYRMESL
jgi:hypothetical protein